MGSRIDLQLLLENILGSDHVYYDPPETVKLKYPAITYSKNNVQSKRADDSRYQTLVRYNLIFVDRRPDNPTIEKLLDLPYCSYDRHYISDNLHHDSLTIYY